MILFFLPVEMLFKFAKEFQGLWIVHYKMSTYKCNIYEKNIPEIFRILKLYYYTPSQKVKQIVSSTNTPDYFANNANGNDGSRSQRNSVTKI